MAKINISNFAARSGRVIGEDGKTYNLVGLLGVGAPISNKQVDISKLAAQSGRIIGEDGKIYNEVELLQNTQDTIEEVKGEVQTLAKLKNWLGETTTPISVGSTANPIVISGISVTAESGDVVKYGDDEFIYSEAGTWQTYDDMLDVYTKSESDERYYQKTETYSKTEADAKLAGKADVNYNLLPTTLDKLKELNTSGTWGALDENEITYTLNSLSFRCILQKLADDVYTLLRILVTGTATDDTSFYLYDGGLPVGSGWLKGCPSGGAFPSGYALLVEGVVGEDSQYESFDTGSGVQANGRVTAVSIAIGSGVEGSGTGLEFVPMLSVVSFKDYPFKAYIPDGAAALGGCLKKTGGQVTGAVTTTKTTFTDDQELVSKKYVDDNSGATGSFKRSVLWTNPGSTNPQTINLSESLWNYDFYILPILNGTFGRVADVLSLKNASLKRVYNHNTTGEVRFSYDISSDGTTLTFDAATTGGVIGQVIGVKFGAFVPDGNEVHF